MARFLKIVDEAYEALNEQQNPMNRFGDISKGISELEALYGKETPENKLGNLYNVLNPKAREANRVKKKLEDVKRRYGPTLLTKLNKQINDLEKELSKPQPPTSQPTI